MILHIHINNVGLGELSHFNHPIKSFCYLYALPWQLQATSLPHMSFIGSVTHSKRCIMLHMPCMNKHDSKDELQHALENTSMNSPLKSHYSCLSLHSKCLISKKFFPLRSHTSVAPALPLPAGIFIRFKWLRKAIFAQIHTLLHWTHLNPETSWYAR